MDWKQVCAAARPLVGEHCKACPVCDGRGCKNAIPGPGAKGLGDVAMRNYDAWRQVRVNMDTLVEPCGPADTSCELFGRRWSMPVFIGPVGDVNRHYGPSLDTLAYNRLSLAAAAAQGVAAFTGDGVDRQLFVNSCEAIREAGGVGVPTVKPWGEDVVADRMELARESGAFAIAMDVDAAGLPFLKGLEPPRRTQVGGAVARHLPERRRPLHRQGRHDPPWGREGRRGRCLGHRREQSRRPRPGRLPRHR